VKENFSFSLTVSFINCGFIYKHMFETFDRFLLVGKIMAGTFAIGLEFVGGNANNNLNRVS